VTLIKRANRIEKTEKERMSETVLQLASRFMPKFELNRKKERERERERVSESERQSSKK